MFTELLNPPANIAVYGISILFTDSARIEYVTKHEDVLFQQIFALSA
jgi:hypothetical protein